MAASLAGPTGGPSLHMGFHRASPVKRRIDPSCASQPARQPPALRQPPGGPAVVRRVIPDSCQQVLPRSRPATPAPAGVGQGAPPVPPARPAKTFPGRPVVRCVPERPRVDGVRGGVVALGPHASAAVPHVGGRGGGASCSHASAPHVLLLSQPVRRVGSFPRGGEWTVCAVVWWL